MFQCNHRNQSFRKLFKVQRKAGVAVVNDGEAADDQKAHFMVDAQLQEIFEVWR